MFERTKKNNHPDKPLSVAVSQPSATTERPSSLFSVTVQPQRWGSQFSGCLLAAGGLRSSQLCDQQTLQRGRPHWSRTPVKPSTWERRWTWQNPKWWRQTRWCTGSKTEDETQHTDVMNVFTACHHVNQPNGMFTGYLGSTACGFFCNNVSITVKTLGSTVPLDSFSKHISKDKRALYHWSCEYHLFSLSGPFHSHLVWSGRSDF